MPIYAYRCAACGHAQDVLQKMSDPVLSVCPACGAATFAKQVTAAGFQLKGSGWYVTDFRGDNNARPRRRPTATSPRRRQEDGEPDASRGAKTRRQRAGQGGDAPAPASAPPSGARGRGARPAAPGAAAGKSGS